MPDLAQVECARAANFYYIRLDEDEVPRGKGEGLDGPSPRPSARGRLDLGAQADPEAGELADDRGRARGVARSGYSG